MILRELSIIARRASFRQRFHERLRREWCFFRLLVRQFRVRSLLILLTLCGGAFLFWKFEGHSPARALHYTYLLVFGEPPEELPAHWALRVVFFATPVIGLTIVLESIVEFALLVRDRRRQERSWCAMMAKTMRDHVVLVGLGRLGYRTFVLLRQLREPVVVIELNAENNFLDYVRQDGSPVIVGDARQDQILTDANVEHARSIILATTDDLANLEVALDARRLNPGIYVVMRMFDPNMAEKVRDGFKIHSAMSQSAVAAPVFATAALDRTIEHSTVVGDELLVMQRWAVSAENGLSGMTVGQVMESIGAAVVEHASAGNKKMFPPPTTPLRPGDEVLLHGPYERLREWRRRKG
jgi:voltage-gated potassium channel